MTKRGGWLRAGLLGAAILALGSLVGLDGLPTSVVSTVAAQAGKV